MHIMLDLETLSTRSNAAIIAIGAVAFDPDKMDIKDYFYRSVMIEDSVKHGHVSGNTIAWWFGQSDEARNKILRNSYSLEASLNGFNMWLADKGELVLWGNGAGFDNVIIENAYNTLGIHTPWSYKNHRCFRTLRAQYPNIAIPNPGIKHHALDDAAYQTTLLMKIARENNLILK